MEIMPLKRPEIKFPFRVNVTKCATECIKNNCSLRNFAPSSLMIWPPGTAEDGKNASVKMSVRKMYKCQLEASMSCQENQNYVTHDLIGFCSPSSAPTF